ncbi:MAG: 4-hydroxybenzoate polyprenyltransferase, partial [Pseudonocardiales bacterium]|nr:4-hydroxybenzoate polyprenyltransferase [Pseudonocardiales bacterium]
MSATSRDLVQDPAAGRGGQHKIRKFLRLVMIEHSVFALPFAYIAALTAMWTLTRSVHWVQLALITVAMVSARTVAMSANRILDRRFDALNPRTARRELVTGELSVRTAWVGTAVALGIAVGTWIGGFDLIYSCQDAAIDREIGSRSFPARFGIPA